MYLPRRLSWSARKKLVDAVFRVSKSGSSLDLPNRDQTDPDSLRDHFLSRESPGWHFDPTDVNRIAERVPPVCRDRTIAEADELCARRFTFRGQPPVILDPIDWHAAPRGDGDWTCDLNRHSWFATLGFAFWYTGEERYANTFVELSSAWIRANGGRLGKLAWDTPFEVAFRVNAWVWAYFLFLPCALWSADDQSNFLRVLGRLSEYLYQTLEYHSPGNHVLLEAKALALCGELFPEFRGARRWRSKGWRILRRELGKQVGPDGVHAERSTMYHKIIAGELAELWLIAMRNDLVQAGELHAVVERMGEFETWIDNGRGDFPLVGDSWAEDTYLRFNAPLICRAHQIGTVPSAGSWLSDHTWWALGPLEHRAVGAEESAQEATNAAKAFPAGGYYVSRSVSAHGTDVLLWDCGPLGYSANRKHAHADALGLTIAVRGVPLLIDPGADGIGPGDLGRAIPNAVETPLRETAAHNTLTVDGKDQGILAERGEIWSAPEPRLRIWATSSECVVMSGHHDGYMRLPEPVRHARTIVAMHHHYWLIVDRLEGAGYHRGEQRFHIAPSAGVEWVRKKQGVRIEKNGSVLQLLFVDPQEGSSNDDLETQIGERIAELHYGRRERIPVVTCGVERHAPYSLVTVIAPGDQDLDARVVSSDSSDGLHIIEVSGDGYRDHVCVTDGAAVTRQVHEGWTTDAPVCILRLQPDDDLKEVFVAGASRLVRSGSDVLPESVWHESAALKRLVRISAE
ncbi:MAG: alginate lyase family protein [Candidatus Palauibacterales bacterium]|nr:alginate lyase family protein [Candidatus Palauibacterales bacterium]